LDAEGYIDPDKIPPAEIKRFVASKPYQATIAHYKNLIALANRQYKGEFEVCDQSRGRVLLWNNKCFHSVEPWKNRHLARAIYILRLFPLVNSKLKLRDRLHGVPFNRHLFDTETGELIVSQGAVDVTRIPSERKLPL
jgi:hypothetical protein